MRRGVRGFNNSKKDMLEFKMVYPIYFYRQFKFITVLFFPKIEGLIGTNF